MLRSLQVLYALKQASRDLQEHPPDPGSTNSFICSPPVKALLQLEAILSNDPNLSSLAFLLSNLRPLIVDRKQQSGSIKNFITRKVNNYSISRVAFSIEMEIQVWIDRLTIEDLAFVLENGERVDEEELLTLLVRFESRVCEGFDQGLQDLVLKSRILRSFERVLYHSSRNSKRVMESCASVICALIRFNKNVFAGEAMLCPLIQFLVSMVSCESLRLLSSLIRCIKSPFVDEIASLGEIPNIICCLDDKDVKMKVAGFDCVLEMGYYGRKEAIEAMLKEGLVEKLAELQRWEGGGGYFEVGELMEERENEMVVEERPFAGCVARFWVQLEVGEGLRQREKRAFKLDILQRVRDACDSEAHAATILAEVLWGSSP